MFHHHYWWKTTSLGGTPFLYKLILEIHDGQYGDWWCFKFLYPHFWAKTTWFGTGTPGSGVCCCYLIVSGNQEGVNGHMCHQEVPSFWTRHRWSQRVISLVPGPRVSKGNRLSCRGKESKFKVISQYHSQLQASEAFQVNGKMLLLIFYFLNLLDCICFSSLHILIDSLLLFYKYFAVM